MACKAWELQLLSSSAAGSIRARACKPNQKAILVNDEGAVDAEDAIARIAMEEVAIMTEKRKPDIAEERIAFLDALGEISGGGGGDDDAKAKGKGGARDKKGAGKDAADAAASAEAQQREAQEQLLRLRAQQDAEMAQTMAKIKDEQTVFDEARARRLETFPPFGFRGGGRARRPHRFPPSLSREQEMAKLREQHREELGASKQDADDRVAQLRAQADMLRSNLGLPTGTYDHKKAGRRTGLAE